MNKLIQFLLCMTILPLISFAEEDTIIRDSKRCEAYYNYFEQSNQIPSNLLKAVSIIESGIWHTRIKRTIPWPWAINVEGKAYYFRNKKDAVDSVRMLLKQGKKSIDVGCMQINLHYHPKAFNSLEEAFEPKHNVAYAAKFLKNNFDRLRSWKGAVAAYHSELPEKGGPYAHKVIKAWQNPDKMGLIENKLQVARNDVVNTQRYIPQSYKYSNRHRPDYAKRAKSDLFVKAGSGGVKEENKEKVALVENLSNEVLKQVASENDK